jgi:hypothetical protein
MTAEIKDKQLIIKIDLQDPPAPSASGKTLLIASTHGNLATSATVQGKPLTVSVNAYIKR